MVVGVATLGVLAVLAAIAACSGPATREATSVASPTTQSSPTTPASTHNQADIMFAHMMIPHHQQAIQMSDMVFAKQGIDPRVIELAKEIKAAQGPEIDMMQGWLDQWGAPNMPGMNGGMHGSMMPGMPDMDDMPGMAGMMSPADMEALQNAQGVAASKLFLTQMIEHHRGAITMAQNEIKNGQSADEVALAQSIATSQQKQIDTMNQILGTL
ncbi:uncharacterized protein (DUF305 family) [Mycolicibacterium sp. BK634]|uniref:DUF305 domain-containing protein n=1 Tax=Mycolicibacterium sp. BK634 TaxID=2587099 RepID=UPI00178D1A6F|nr:uncharacterized protein (DUF305 family) [Mycolicibacterium sp. BK634]